MASGGGKHGSSDRFRLPGFQDHCGQWLKPWNWKIIGFWQKHDDKFRQCVVKKRHYSANKGLYSQSYGLPSGHIQLWQMDCKEGRAHHGYATWGYAMVMLWLLLRLLHQPGGRLCRGCHANQERRSMSWEAAPTAPQQAGSLLAHTLPTLGSVNSKTNWRLEQGQQRTTPNGHTLS